MYPVLFGIELYRPILAISVALQVGLLLWLVRREGFAARSVLAYVLLLGVLGYLGAKAASIVFHGGLRDTQVELAGGLRYPGALLGVLGFGYLLRRMLPPGLSYGHFVDLWAPSFALACAVGRLGCLLTGCCFGAPSDLPWHLRYPRGSAPWWAHYQDGLISTHAPASLPVHPFPLYLFAMELGILALTLYWLRHKSYHGQVLLIFLALHGLLKAGIELTRDPYHPLHQVVLPVALVAAALLAAHWWSTRREPLPVGRLP